MSGQNLQICLSYMQAGSDDTGFNLVIEALDLIETSMVIDDVARYRRIIPGPVSQYVALEAIFYAALLVAAGYLVTWVREDISLALLLPVFFMAIVGILGLKNDYKLMERSIRAKVRSDHTLYNNIVVSLYNETSAETLVNIGCDYLSKYGELKLLFVIAVPAQLPFEYGTTQKEEGGRLLSLGMRFARRRNVNASASIAITRHPGDAVLEMGKRFDAGLIVMGAGRATTAEILRLEDAGDRVMKKSRCDVIVIHL